MGRFNGIEHVAGWIPDPEIGLRLVPGVGATNHQGARAARRQRKLRLPSPKVDVPTSDTLFPAGPGSDAINNNCLACHSADHVLNQPSLSREAWQEVVNKMITAYKAPVTPDDAKAIVDYLVRIKGAS